MKRWCFQVLFPLCLLCLVCPQTSGTLSWLSCLLKVKTIGKYTHHYLEFNYSLILNIFWNIFKHYNIQGHHQGQVFKIFHKSYALLYHHKGDKRQTKGVGKISHSNKVCYESPDLTDLDLSHADLS